MSDMAERLISPISTAELERRWGAVRAAMAAQKIDVLVMQSSNEFSGGYVKWFTDMPSGNGWMTTVIVPKDDLMTVVAPGPFGIDNAPPAGDPVRRGIKRFLASPNFMGASFTTALDLDEHRQGDGGVFRRHHRAGRAGLDGPCARRASQARQARQCALRRRDRAGRPAHGDQERRGDRADPRHRASAGPRHARRLRRHQAGHARHRGDGGGRDLHPQRRRGIRPADGRVVADRRSR